MSKPKAKLRQRARRGQPEPYRRADGRWAVTLDLGRRPDGRRWRHPVYGPSPEAVREAIPEARARATAEHPRFGPETTVIKWCEHWIKTIEPMWDQAGRRTGMKHSSWRGYEKHVRLSIGGNPLTLLGRTRVAFVTPRLVQEWIDYLGTEARGLGPRSVKYALTTLDRAMRAARIEGLIKVNPCDDISPPSQTAYKATIFNLEEARRFLRIIKGHKDEALILVATFAGPRQGETLSLKRTDLNMTTGVVTFGQTLDWIAGQPVPEENKNSTERSFRLPAYVMDVVRRHLDEIDAKAAGTKGWTEYGMLFPGEHGQPLRGSTIYRRFQALLAANDLPTVRWHDLRHSAASIMLAVGLPLQTVQRSLGWSSLQMISQRYGHLIPELAEAEVAKMHAALVDFDQSEQQGL
jgi:integrase